ncbi:MAG: alpha/beta fold hydrolase [Rhodobacteraceae bacterium]|nr:alpha/beta fold hydrolase [Paracoccaceae bacterium]
MASKTFVLVHGIWHGGWCWSRLAGILRARGHTVSTPTLTGLGERSHLLSRGITLTTFVTDIVNHLDWDDLRDVILVGHSFGGAPVTGAADLRRDRIAQIVYLDGIMMEHGETWFDLVSPELAQSRQAQSEQSSGGLSLPVAPVEKLGVTFPDDVAFLAPRLTPHPFATFTTALDLRHPIGNGLPCTYIRCTDPPYPPADIAFRRAQARGWPIHDIATGHDAMVTAPEALAEILEHL